MNLEEHVAVRELALKLYTDVLSGQIIDKDKAWGSLLSLVDALQIHPELLDDESDGIYNILADLLCELCFEELCHKFSNEFVQCISRSHVAVRIGFCVSVTQRLYEMTTESGLEKIPDTLMECMKQLLLSIPASEELVRSCSLDKNVCHILEVFYREVYDLTSISSFGNYARELLGRSAINPAYLLSNMALVKLSSHPEIAAALLSSAGALLPYCETNEQLTAFGLCQMLRSFDWKRIRTLTSSSDAASSAGEEDDDVDIELVAAWQALTIQLLVRAISNETATSTTAEAGSELSSELASSLFLVCVSALVINRLSMTAKLMTEVVDVGLLALSDTHTTELTAITSGVETLVCLAADDLVGVFNDYFSELSKPSPQSLTLVMRIITAAGIIDQSLERTVAEWLVTDALCFIANNLRYYSTDLNKELSEERGVLKTFFEVQLANVGHHISVVVPTTENWIRAFLLSTLLRLLSGHLKLEWLLELSRLLVSSAWWCPNSRQKRLQAAYVCCHLVEQLLGDKDVEVCNSSGQTIADSAEHVMRDSLYKAYAESLTEDETSLAGMLSIIWTLYDESSEVVVREWCVTAYKTLESVSHSPQSQSILAQFNLFMNPRGGSTAAPAPSTLMV